MLYRIQLDLAFDNKSDMDIIVQAVKKVKSKATLISADKVNMEDTTRASWHICHHDTGDRPCEPEEKI